MIRLKCGVGKCVYVYTAIYKYILLVYTVYYFWFVQLGINMYILILDKGICYAMHGTGLLWYWNIIKLCLYVNNTMMIHDVK